MKIGIGGGHKQKQCEAGDKSKLKSTIYKYQRGQKRKRSDGTSSQPLFPIVLVKSSDNSPL